MERIKISSTLTMSQLVYGMWRLGDDEDTSPDHVRNKIESCLDQHQMENSEQPSSLSKI